MFKQYNVQICSAKSKRANTYALRHVHTHARTHLCTYTRMHTHTHARTHPSRTRPRTYTRMYTHPRTHTHARTHPCTHTRMHAHPRTHTHARTHTDKIKLSQLRALAQQAHMQQRNHTTTRENCSHSRTWIMNLLSCITYRVAPRFRDLQVLRPTAR